MESLKTISEMIRVGKEKQMPAFVARPAGLPADRCLVLLGGMVDYAKALSPHIQNVADRLAQNRFTCLVPDLFYREGGLGAIAGPAAMKDVWDAISDERVVADLKLCLDYLSSLGPSNPKVGVFGFCMGGLFAYLASCKYNEIHACVSYYGPIRYKEQTKNKPISPIDAMSNLKAPLLGFFGEDDRSIPVEDVKALGQELEKLGKKFRIKVYPNAAHGFFNDTLPNYRASPARDSWQIALEFLNQTLR